MTKLKDFLEARGVKWPESKIVPPDADEYLLSKYDEEIGYNQALDDIASLTIPEKESVTREGLARIIEGFETYKEGIKQVSPEHFYQMSSLALADAILAKFNLKEGK